MISLKGAIIGVTTGIFFALSWVIFVDGQITSPDKFPGTHIIPPVIATIAAILMNFTNPKQVQEVTLAKIWMFLCVTTMTICIGASIFILTREYMAYDNWAGVSMMLMTV